MMNQFGSCASESALGGPLNAMFSGGQGPATGATALQNSSLPFDYAQHYARYHQHNSSANNNAPTPGSYIASPNGTATTTTGVQYGAQPLSASSGSSSYGTTTATAAQYITPSVDYPPSAQTYPTPPTPSAQTSTTLDYFSARAKSANVVTPEYSNLFSNRTKFSLDFNNNNNHNNLPNSDVKREGSSDDLNEKVIDESSNQVEELCNVGPIATTDDDYEEDDEDDGCGGGVLSSANLRTPIYISPNCILYSYIGVDTLGAINEHFQRSFAMLFQNMRSSSVPGTTVHHHPHHYHHHNHHNSTNSSTTGSSDWSGASTNLMTMDDSFSSGARAKLWPQSYYKDVHQQQSNQIVSGQSTTTARTDNTTNETVVIDKRQLNKVPTVVNSSISSSNCDEQPKLSPHSPNSPLGSNGKVKPLLSISPCSGSSSINPGTGGGGGGGGAGSSRSCSRSSIVVGSNPQSPKELTTPSSCKSAGEEESVNLDANSGALMVTGYNHQTLRSAQYHRRYERRKRRYLKRLQLMHTPMIRRKLPISFWKFSTRFSCYYASSGNGYQVSPYMSSPTAANYGQLCARSGQMGQQAQFVGGNQSSYHHQAVQPYFGGSSGGYLTSGLVDQTGDQQQQSADYGGYDADLVHQHHHQHHHHAQLSTSVMAACAHPIAQPPPPQSYRPPLSLSVSMTIGGGLGNSGQTPTTSSATLVTSSITSTTTSTATTGTASSSSSAGSGSSTTSAAAAAAAAALATLNNDLTLDISMHISPSAIALGAAAAANGTQNAAYRGISDTAAPGSGLYHHHHHQNHHSSYLGLLQSSLQHASASEASYHHHAYYQYSSKLTTNSGGASGSTTPGITQPTTANQQQNLSSNPNYSTYSAGAANSAGSMVPINSANLENSTWGRGASAYYGGNHYPSSFSHMMMAHHHHHHRSANGSAYPSYGNSSTDGSADPTAAATTSELVYPSAGEPYHQNYDQTAAAAAVAANASSPFIAVAAAVRSYQDAVISQQHHHHHNQQQTNSMDSKLSDNGTVGTAVPVPTNGSQLLSNSSLYLQH